MFYDPSAFAFVPVLERHWRDIYAEYLGVRPDLVDWHEKKLYDEGWKVLTMYDFPHGQPIPETIRKCPVTSALVREHIPTHGVAGFSVLRPQTRIKPHQGYQGNFLRCHLALQVPPGDTALVVNGELRRWEVGKALVFDDRVWHEAWNLADDERVVLLIDFVPSTNK